MKVSSIVTALLLSVLLSAAAHAETIHLSVAASMTDAFNEIIAGFSARHPQAQVQPNFASSGSMAKQIEQGAPADIFVSANPKWMKYLAEKQLIEAGTDRIFAYNALVFVSAKPGAAQDITDLPVLERIAIGTPQSVPAGQYARQAMEKAGVYAELEQTRKLIMAKDVRQALLYADQGEVDGAFVYATDALLAKNARILFTVPDDLYDRVSYPLALTIEGGQKETAKAFYDYLSSAETVTILEKYGFQPAR